MSLSPAISLALHPMRFRPILRQALWGGRRLESRLGKSLPASELWSESWEICDLGDDQTLVEAGPLAGMSLGQLVAERGRDLLGRHHPQPRFPFLLKFLDAAQTLSVQVHPNDDLAARLNPPVSGKSEGWFVLESGPESMIYAGLRQGVDRAALVEAIRAGRCQECLHAFHPAPGDCIFLPAGTVHALGNDLLVAEIQQTANTTYRLFDWNRRGPDGQARTLHIDQGLAAINFRYGPVQPCRPQATSSEHIARLIAGEHFVMDRWEFDSAVSAGGDQRCHLLSVLEGAVHVEDNPAEQALTKGMSILLPAAAGATRVIPQGRAVLLDCYLP